MAEAPQPAQSKLQALWKSWATRSLIIGAIGAGIDIVITNIVVYALTNHVVDQDARWRIGAMTGLVIGVSINFLLNRHFTFREHATDFVSSMLRFAVMTVAQSLVHGQIVVMIGNALRDVTGPTPFLALEGVKLEMAKLTFAKVVADILVFTVLHTVMLRYLIFPKKKVVSEQKDSA